MKLPNRTIRLLLLAAAMCIDAGVWRKRDTFEINPHLATARCGLGEVFDRRGAKDDAIREYRHCLEILGWDNEQEPRAGMARQRLRELGVGPSGSAP